MVRHYEVIRPQSWKAGPGAAGIELIYVQHATLAWVAGGGTGEQPHSPLPSFFASTSAMQQASDASGAGPPPQADAAGSLSYACRVLQTPVSGSSSCTSSAAGRSPARAAAIERTCSQPVAIRKFGTRP